MLANGTLLGVKFPGSDDYTDLPGLKTVPDMTSETENVENTPLSAANKRYEAGIGDFGSLEYTFVHVGNTADSAYRMLRPYSDSKTPLEWRETWIDGTMFDYTAIPSVGFTRGGGTNTVVDLKVTMSLQSDIIPTDPTE